MIPLKGEINEYGSVKIPINKLKGVLKENYSGKIFCLNKKYFGVILLGLNTIKLGYTL